MTTGGSFAPLRLSGQTWGVEGNNDLVAAGAGVYVPLTGMSVVLPEPGTYALTADVRAAITGQPSCNAYVLGRLFNVTAGAPLPNSARLVVQALDSTPAGASPFADQTTAPITEELTVTVPTTIRLEAAYFAPLGVVISANATNLAATGRSRLAYELIR